MARATSPATKIKRTRKAAAVEPVQDIDELEELEELEDLEEDEAPVAKPKRRGRPRKAPVVVEDDEDDEDDEDEDDEDEIEDDEDEDEEPAPRRSRSRSRAKTKPEAKPARTRKVTAKSAVAKKSGLATARELPPGKVGISHVAELIGKDERVVRVWLRHEDQEDLKDQFKVDGRYEFTPTQAAKVAKRYKASKK